MRICPDTIGKMCKHFYLIANWVSFQPSGILTIVPNVRFAAKRPYSAAYKVPVSERGEDGKRGNRVLPGHILRNESGRRELRPKASRDFTPAKGCVRRANGYPHSGSVHAGEGHLYGYGSVSCFLARASRFDKFGNFYFTFTTLLFFFHCAQNTGGCEYQNRGNEGEIRDTVAIRYREEYKARFEGGLDGALFDIAVWRILYEVSGGKKKFYEVQLRESRF